jgi:metal-dependent hydrolase (beta-lactamase superfamily II)
MSKRKASLIELGNIHGFRIRGDQKKYDTLKEAKKGTLGTACCLARKKKDAHIVVYGKSHKGVVRKVKSI